MKKAFCILCLFTLTSLSFGIPVYSQNEKPPEQEQNLVLETYHALEAAFQQQREAEINRLPAEDREALLNYAQEIGFSTSRLTSLWTSKGVPRYISGWGMKVPFLQPENVVEAPEQAAAIFLQNFKALFRMQDPSTELRVSKIIERRGYYVKMEQLFQGLPIFHGQIILRFSPAYEVIGLSSNYVPNINLAIVPNVTSDEAVRVAQETLNFQPTEVRTTLGIFDPEIFSVSGASPLLTWKIDLLSELEVWNVYVDAQSGEVLYTDDNIHSALKREMYTANDNDIPPSPHDDYLIFRDDPYCDNSQNPSVHCSNAGWPEDAPQALSSLQSTYDYYAQAKFDLGRDGWDNAGSTLEVWIDWDPDGDGIHCNAQWQGSIDRMRLGSNSLTTHREVVGHEHAHAIQDAESSDCLGNIRCRTVHESWGDIAGHFIDGYSTGQYDWFLSNCINYDMSNPSGQDHLMMYNPIAEHFSRGILAKAAHLLSEGETHYEVPVTGIGVSDSERIWYDVVLEGNIIDGFGYTELGQAMVTSAGNLFDVGSIQEGATRQAMDSIGISRGDFTACGSLVDGQVSTIKFNYLLKDRSFLFYKKPSADDLYYRYVTPAVFDSSFGCSAWSEEIYLDSTDKSPSAIIYNGDLWVFFRDPVSGQIFYRILYPNGPWSLPLSAGTSLTDNSPSAAVFSGKIYLFWKSQGGNNIFYRTYDGLTWSGSVQLEGCPGGGACTSVTSDVSVAPVVFDNNLWVFYKEPTALPVPGDVSYVQSIDGTTFSEPDSPPFSPTTKGPPVVSPNKNRLYIATRLPDSGIPSIHRAFEQSWGTQNDPDRPGWSRVVQKEISDVARLGSLFEEGTSDRFYLFYSTAGNTLLFRIKWGE